MEEMRLADERLNVLEHPLIAHDRYLMRDKGMLEHIQALIG